MSQPTHDHDIAGKLADWCTDFDGSPMSPAEAPLDGLHCDDLYSAINEILALRTRAQAAEKMCRDLEMQLIAAKPLYSRRQLEKRCEELEAALEPFAKAGQIIDGPFGPALFAEDDMAFQSGCAWSENGVRKTITWGDFRRARSALSKEQG